MNNKKTVKKADHFIMSPTVDVCFAGLMENPIVRKGFCAAILRINPGIIGDTELLPTHLRRDYADDKLGILDVLVRLADDTRINLEMQIKYFEFWDERALFYLCKTFFEQLRYGEPYEKLHRCIHVSILDFIRFPEDDRCYRRIFLRDSKDGRIYTDKLELQILELKKLPKKIHSEEEIVNWMNFLNANNRREFEDMAEKNEYLSEAYEALKKLSSDEKRRIEYEARDKALKDYNTQIGSAERRGEKRGEKRGRRIGKEQGIRTACKVFKMSKGGASVEKIAKECSLSVQKVKEILR